jgi:hypothetical protein
MRMKPTRFLWLLLTCLAVWPNLAIGAAKGDSDFFPIMAWGGIPADPAALKQMKDCGITVAGLASPKQLDACAAAGLKALVNDPRAQGYDWQNVDEAAAKKNIASLVAETGNHPAAIGYYLTDEPNVALFAGMAKVVAAIRAAAPGKIPFINLLPNYANAGQLGASSYDQYLETFVKTCNPSILSYDHYALMDDGSLRDGYYQNLESIRRASLKQGIPFWNVVLAVAHLSYRPPTQADFAFQAYTTLANGGRGIVYFMYFCPLVGNYRMAPIDPFGHRTTTWFNMQNVNLQVLERAPTLAKLKSDDVYHLGKVPHDCHGPGEKNLIKQIPGGDFLAGDFTHSDGTRYVMVVNKDLTRSHPCFPVFNKPPKKLLVVLPYSGETDVFQGEQAWLAPGQGALLRLEE